MDLWDGANSERVSREGMGASSDETQEDMLARRPIRLGLNSDTKRVRSFETKASSVADAVMKVSFEVRKDERGAIEGGGCNEVIPRGENETAMNHEEDEERDGEKDVGGLEELIVTVSNP